ncbi:MAG: hypothetical protein HY867_03405 [Chloroflexi bacterium]|nr:hypothetical protein [Chloroflexota bacterium]
MFSKIIATIKTIFEEETLAHRSQRMIPAALYGALIASLYSLTLAFVNVYTFPSLPLGMDWGRTLTMWLGFGVAAALFGALAAWFTDDTSGAVGGGVTFTILLGIVFLLSSDALTSASTFQSILMAATLVGVNMLAAGGLRWMANRHLEIQHDETAARRQRLTKHILTIALIGLVPGVFSRMDLNAQQTIGGLHELLQAAPADPSVLPRLPLKQVPELEKHLGVDYIIYARTSAFSAGALDVTVQFEDGFAMSCVLPTASGVSFITDCNEGNTVKR